MAHSEFWWQISQAFDAIAGANTCRCADQSIVTHRDAVLFLFQLDHADSVDFDKAAHRHRFIQQQKHIERVASGNSFLRAKQSISGSNAYLFRLPRGVSITR